MFDIPAEWACLHVYTCRLSYFCDAVVRNVTYWNDDRLPKSPFGQGGRMFFEAKTLRWHGAAEKTFFENTGVVIKNCRC